MQTQTKKLIHAYRQAGRGFTIIEVMIVLAIAGLILAIIFLAVPALQRNSRNNSRTNDAAHLAGLVNEYASNHAGQLPTGVAPPAADLDLANENWAIMADPLDGDFLDTNTFPVAGDNDRMIVIRDYRCNSDTNTLSQQTRSFAITFRVETSSGDAQKCIQG